MKNKKMVRKFAVQAAISLFYIILTYGVIISVFSGTETFRYDLSMQSYFNNGRYASCLEQYLWLDAEEAQKEVYMPYREFADFYMTYLLFTEYKNASSYDSDADIKSKAANYLQHMKEIRDNSSFTNNIHHYDYLIEQTGK